MNETVANKGYLREDFRLFHLRDRRSLAVEAHYHEFDKVVLLLSGRVEYTVEGVAYTMEPGDILLVRHHDVHRPVIDGESDYERIVLWIAPDYLALFRDGDWDLERAFALSSQRRSALCRPAEEPWAQIRALAQALEKNETEPAFGRALTREANFVLLLTAINRCVLSGRVQRPEQSDGQIDLVLRYINSHLAEELSVDELAAMCYLSRYYFMRRFKAATGYTVHGYVQLKRLTAVSELLSAGVGAGDAAGRCGFGDYSAFLRAFRKQYGVTPGAFARGALRALEGGYRE